MEGLFWIILSSIFVFGAAIGSFLNCWIWRFETGQSALRGRSMCPKCRHSLAWFDLMPLASFFFLRGRCRYCQKPISRQYPAVELATGFLFCAAAWKFAPLVLAGKFLFFNIFELVAWWVILAALIVIFVIDLRHYLIPDEAIAWGVIGALGLQLARFWESQTLFGRFEWQIILDPVWAGLAAAGFFLAVFLAGRGKWLGFGDVKLAFLMGLALGFPQALAALFLGNFFGAIMGLGMIAANKMKMSSKIPFGPFLVAGTLAAAFFFEFILDFYLSIGT